MNDISDSECLIKLKEMRAKIISEMKTSTELAITYTEAQKETLTNETAISVQVEDQFLQKKNDFEVKAKQLHDLEDKLNLEKSILQAAISHKEKEISEMEYIVLQKNPADFANYEFLFRKEMEIYNKMKVENNFLFSKGDGIVEELKEMIRVYKEIAQIDLEKTKEGYLNIKIFRGLKPNYEGANLMVEIKEGSFKVISVYPRIKINIFEEELKVSQNFTLFLTKIANEFLKELK